MITIYLIKDEYAQECHKFAKESMDTLRDFGNYLRTLSDKGDADDISSEIYERFFTLMDINNLSRDIVGF